MSEHQEMTVDASPTKSFFISMLVKDIPLIRAVIDLVDNSVDGARRLRPNSDYQGLWIQVELNNNSFKISDNCGGIGLEVAQKYAFRFGRPSQAPALNYSVGQFGVGMKRAIFKFGNFFKVASSHNDAAFSVEANISEWAANQDLDWEFQIKDLVEYPNSSNDQDLGTTIEVNELYESVSNDFGSEKFQKRLMLDLQLAQQYALDKGLHISLNGSALKAESIQLLASDELKPVFREDKFPIGNSTVYVKLYAGISQPDPSKAGWYIYCNGRLILEADQSNITGWREAGLESGEIDAGVQYHNDFARFRGYIYFESADTSKLPWNTTKTGPDTDTPIYRKAQGLMISAMIPVLEFLRRFTREVRETPDNDYQLGVANATLTRLDKLPEQKIFGYSEPPTKEKRPPQTTISFTRDKAEVDKVKKHLKVSSNRDVGEKTYEYYIKMEDIN